MIKAIFGILVFVALMDFWIWNELLEIKHILKDRSAEDGKSD